MKHPPVLWSRPLACALIATLSFVATLSAAETNQSALTGFPFTDEDLNFSVDWPTGISLGEAHMHARHSGTNWSFAFTLDASLPGYTIKDSYHSDVALNAASDFCTVSFDRSAVHGSRSIEEKESVDRERAIATRQPKTGGSTEIPVPACVKDALAYFYYARREMGQGRVPAPQDILLGALHPIRVEYVGAPVITMNGKPVVTDEVTCTFTNGASQSSFDIYYARDAARTPLRITAPFALGRFSMELIR